MDQPAYANATIHTSVPLPKFDTRDPRIFFELIGSISPDDKTKFLTALTNLPYKAVEKAKHLLSSNLTDAEKFLELKTIVVKLYTCSQEDNWNTLHNLTSMGDRNAREHLDYIRKLLPDDDKNSATVKHFFYKTLPHTIAPMARILPDEDLEVVADAVDRSLNQCKHTQATNMCAVNMDINAFQKPKPSYEERLSTLEAKIAEHRNSNQFFEQQFHVLRQQLADLPAKLRGPYGVQQNAPANTQTHRATPRMHYNANPQSPRNQPHNNAYQRQQQNSETLCYYHKSFGKDARKCVAPCNFRAEN